MERILGLWGMTLRDIFELPDTILYHGDKNLLLFLLLNKKRG